VSKSLLTVILPVHNGAAFVASAIRSVLNQTYKDFELWVLENGSTDRTAEIVRSITDPRIKLFELGPVGIQGALQYGIENTSTEWLARMDADDLMFPNRLEVQMNFIRKNPKIAFIGSAYAILTPSGHILEPVLHSGTREVTKDLLACMKRFFADPSVVFNRHAALNAGGVDKEFKKIDGPPLFFRLLTKGKGWEIAEHLHLYRLRSNSLSRGMEHAQESRRVRAKYAPELLDALSKNLPPKSFWQHIARLELISGDPKSVLQAARFMRKEGPFESEASRMIARSLISRFNPTYYTRRNFDKYRHRRDWEELFWPLLESDPYVRGIKTNGQKNDNFSGKS